MKKHIPLIVVILLTIGIIVTYILYARKSMNYRHKIIDKAIEEFTFDYDEEVIAIDTQALTGENNKIYYIVKIYGEETLVTYIYFEGEIWNYENKSN